MQQFQRKTRVAGCRLGGRHGELTWAGSSGAGTNRAFAPQPNLVHVRRDRRGDAAGSIGQFRST